MRLLYPKQLLVKVLFFLILSFIGTYVPAQDSSLISQTKFMAKLSNFRKANNFEAIAEISQRRLTEYGDQLSYKNRMQTAHDLGRALFFLGDYRESINRMKEYVTGYQCVSDSCQIISDGIWEILGHDYSGLGIYDSTVYAINQGLSILLGQEVLNYEKIVRRYDLLVYMFEHRIDNVPLRDYYLEKNWFYLQKWDGDKYWLERYYMTKARICSPINFSVALEYYFLVLKQVDSTNGVGFNVCYTNIANVYNRNGNFEKAISYYRKALLYLDYKGLKAQQIPLELLNLGKAYFKMGNRDSAIFYVDRTIATTKERNLQDEPYFLEFWALKGKYLKSYEEGRPYLDFALARLTELGDAGLDSREAVIQDFAEWFNEQDQWDSVIKYSDMILYPDKVGAGHAFSPYPKNRDTEWMAALKAKSLYELGISRSDTFLLEQALKYYQEGAQYLTDQILALKTAEGQLQFIPKVNEIYADMIDVSLAYYNLSGSGLDSVWMWMEKGKSTILKSQMQTNKYLLRSIDDQDVLTNILDTKMEIRKLEIQAKSGNADDAKMRLTLFALRNRLDSIEGLVGNEVEHKEDELISYSLSDVKEDLTGKDKGLIQFYEGENALQILFVGDGVTQAKTVEGKDWLILKEQIEEFRKLLSQGYRMGSAKQDFKRYNKVAYHIYEKLFSGLELPSELEIFPSGVLNYIPFEALLNKPIAKNARLDYASLPYLVKKHQISYAYSASWLAMLKKGSNFKKPVNGVLGMAVNLPTNYNLSEIDWPALPGTSKEMKSLEAYLGSSFEGYSGVEATEDLFKLKQNDFDALHLALHNWVDTVSQENGGLLFYPSKEGIKEDGVLHSYEMVAGFKPSSLVVLSACETAIGELNRGEGLFSMGRAFAQNGARNLVISLWAVSDVYTSKQMASFYKTLNDEQMPAAALREAKLKLLLQADEIAAHPSNWAAFVVFGNTPIELNTGRQSSFYLWSSLLLLGIPLFVVIKRRKRLAKLAA